jgi:hypothetical protein
LWGNDGSVSNEDARTCIRLLGQEVMPAMREIGKELGLKDPFETLDRLPQKTARSAGRRGGHVDRCRTVTRLLAGAGEAGLADACGPER